ncbi:AMP-binding protein [Photorhabdus viridis]|uniref:AMP-binding protein n=1 Tax=Photorhabdus viridis TaxID=3163327 RepID=UPI0033075E07
MKKNNLILMIKRFENNNNVAYYDHSNGKTFSEIYSEIKSILNYFDFKGITKGKKVISFMDKTFSEFSLFYACLLKGVAFCPLDNNIPSNRLSMIISDVNPDLIVADDFYIGDESSFREDLLIHKDCIVSNGEFISPLEHDIYYEDSLITDYTDTIAYIIFTSGSTGKPKGVQITHDNFNSFIDALYPQYVSEKPEKYLSIGPLYFDMTILDSVLPPLYGHSVYLYKPPFIPSIFANIIERYNITRFSCVPSVLKILLPQLSEGGVFNQFKSLNLILLGAEKPNEQSIKILLENIPQLKVINAYGPTEGTMCCFSSEITSDNMTRDISIGKPFRGLEYILETSSGYSKFGEGKLLISGNQIMKGYINHSQCDDPFIFHNGVKYYDTNDIVKVSDDGIFYFLGRSDDEVKLNGFRVHLQDVEMNIKQLLNVGNIFLHKYSTNSKDYLVLSYEENSIVDPNECFINLEKLLPKYMVPNIFLVFKSLPRLRNSKLDRSKIQSIINEKIESSNKTLPSSRFITLKIQ